MTDPQKYETIVARILKGPSINGLRDSLIPPTSGKYKGRKLGTLFTVGGYSDEEAYQQSNIGDRRFGTDKDGTVILVVFVRLLERREAGGWTFCGVAEVEGDESVVAKNAQKRFDQFSGAPRHLYISGVYNTHDRSGFMNVGLLPQEHVEGGL